MLSALKQAVRIGNPKHLWKRYAAAVVLIAALLSTTHIAASLALEANARNAELINMSGRQRMLSQRILFHSLQATDHDEAGVKERLIRSIDLLTASQRTLSADPRLSQDLVDLYLGDQDLNARVYEFSEIARQIAITPSESETALTQLLALDSEALLRDLNKAVSLFEAQAEEDASRLELIQNASFYAALVILLLEGLLIFVPAQRVVTRSITNLETQSKIVTRAKVEAVRRNQELELLKDRVEHEAMHDSLTELPNRRALEAHMAKLKSLAQDTEGTLSVLHVDLDRFKQINDTLGHAAGDHVLKHVAATLRACVRPDDMIARVGGDEFVILPALNISEGELTKLAERIIEAMRQPIPYKDNVCHFGASIGIGIGISTAKSSAIDPADLLVKADIALYHAKERGRGRFEFFTPELATKVETAKRTSDELLEAFERDQLLIHYQPIFSSREGSVSSIEALVRWDHPIHGILSAGAFIDHVYQLGLAAELDILVLEKIEQDLTAAEAQGLKLPPIAINVSANSLRQGHLLKRIRRSPLVDHGLSLEISETVDFDNEIDNINAQLQDIRCLGVKIEIDDFGTGHASVFSFQKLEPDRIKIARELIIDIKDSQKTRRLISGTCKLAKSFGSMVVAEGAEDLESAQILQALGCDYIQGFGLSRPKGLDQLLMELFLTDRSEKAANA